MVNDIFWFKTKVYVNSSPPSAPYMRQWTGSTLLRLMACCLVAPNHLLNQYWLIASKVTWHSSEGIRLRISEDTNKQIEVENCIFKVAFRSPRGQWVKIAKYGHSLYATTGPHQYGDPFTRCHLQPHCYPACDSNATSYYATCIALQPCKVLPESLQPINFFATGGFLLTQR